MKNSINSTHNKARNKALIFILSSILVFSFAGCGKKDDAPASSTPTTPQTSSVADKTADKTDDKTSKENKPTSQASKKDEPAKPTDDKTDAPITAATAKTKITASKKAFDANITTIKGLTAGTDAAKKIAKEKLAKVKTDFTAQSALMKKITGTAGISAKSKKDSQDLQKAFDNTITTVVDPFLKMIETNQTKKLSSIIPKIEEVIKLAKDVA
ncbi:MAG: hypothetical protein RSA99_02905 [Oscillospiraceae bacterium]